MILAIDIGNTQLFAGVFKDGKIQLRFRKSSKIQSSSDEFGLFLRQVLRENQVDPNLITDIVISSVVPDLNHALASACIKYFNLSPLMLRLGVKTGLKIKTTNPQSVGSDLIADAVAACHLYPNQNRLIVNLGTANTYSLVNDKNEYLGHMITPGMRVSMQALASTTAQLPEVAIKKPDVLIGKTTVDAIQSGLYFNTLGMIKEVKKQIRDQFSIEQDIITIGTGGVSILFEEEKLFDQTEPDLVLLGLYLVLKINQNR